MSNTRRFTIRLPVLVVDVPTIGIAWRPFSYLSHRRVTRTIVDDFRCESEELLSGRKDVYELNALLTNCIPGFGSFLGKITQPPLRTYNRERSRQDDQSVDDVQATRL